MKIARARGQSRDARLARRQLVDQQAQIAAAGAELVRLQREIAAAEQRLATGGPTILEVNEQLLISALRAHGEVDAALEALGVVTRSAEIDTLTELPNRVRLRDRFAQAMATARRRRTRLALLFIDLDGFKQINDTLGHAVGDEVLKRAAHCFRSSVRDSDTVSRHGGDEFVVLLNEVSHASDAARIAVKLIEALGAPFALGEHVLRMSASIGISVYPEDGEDFCTLIDRADAAMYRAKRQGPGDHAFSARIAADTARQPDC